MSHKSDEGKLRVCPEYFVCEGLSMYCDPGGCDSQCSKDSTVLQLIYCTLKL